MTHGRTVGNLHDLLAHAIVIEPPDDDLPDPGVLRFFRGRKFLPALLAKAIMEDIDIVSDPMTGLVYRWEGKFWEQYDLAHIRSKALLMLQDEGNSAKAADVANMVRDLSTLPIGRRMNDHSDLICLQSGMFNLKTGELTPHDKSYFSTYMLPIDFNPQKVPDCLLWKASLEQWVKDTGSIRELQKFAGYCLTRETRYERMLMLLGPGGDGKSTWMNIMRQMVGPDNCSHIPMGRLEDQFYLSRLVDKLINMGTEVESKAMQSMEMKAIVSGDTLCASFKNQTPFDFDPFCKLIYSTNRLPKILDNSDGFFRKIMIVKFEGQFVKNNAADIFLKDKLLDELPGIFAWALAGLVMLQEDKGFLDTPLMKETLQEYKQMNNNVLYFIQKHVVSDPSSKVLKSSCGKLKSAYEQYCDRCRGWNLPPFGEPHFQKEFVRLLRDIGMNVKDGKMDVIVDALSNTTRRAHCYAGLSIVEEKMEGGDSLAPPPLPLLAGGLS
jgi:putative DNA primase/helicase